MKDTSYWRIKLNNLRIELMKAWFERPFPADKIALLNHQLKEAVDRSGFTIEGKAKTSRLSRNRYYAMHPNAVPRDPTPVSQKEVQ